MIFILSEPEDLHVESVTSKLDALQAPYYWFYPKWFPAEAEFVVRYEQGGLSRRTLRYKDQCIDLGEVTAVWYRRPGIPEAGTEVGDARQREWISIESYNFLMGLWQTMDCAWLPGIPFKIYAAENKVKQLELAARLGFRIPRTRITNRPEELLDLYAQCGGRLTSKAVWQGGGRRRGENVAIYTHAIRRRDVVGYRTIRHAPVILQEYVPKQVELRVTVVGSQVFAAEIQSQESRGSRVDWRRYFDPQSTPYAPHALPVEIERLCVRLLREYDIEFGAIDMILTPAQEYVFIEINPNGQWLWIEELTGLPIAEAIARFLIQGSRSTDETKIYATT